jgi:hypothetical protein
MNKSYLYSLRNSALPLKPSKTICLLMMILSVGFFGNLMNAQKTSLQFDSQIATKTLSKTSSTLASQSIPTISSLASSSGCVGMSITINGSNFSGATAADVKIGGTAVSSITSISDTQIIAEIGNGTTGNVTVTTSGGTATSSNVFVVYSTGPVAPGSISGSTNQCEGNTSQVYSVSPVANTDSYDWHIPADWTITSGSGTNSITVTVGLISGNVYVNTINTCGIGYGANQWITVSAPTPTPEVTLTQPSCLIPTGTITVTSPSPATGITYTVVGTNPVIAAVTNTTGIFPGLPEGDYNVTANNVSGCISSPTSVTLSLSLTTKTWNGTWSPSAPTSDDLAIINANYSASSNGDLNACSLIINCGYKLTVEAGKFVIIQNDLTVNGTLDVLDKGSLVMVKDAGTVTNNGTTKIHRFTTVFKMYDYIYWSTPVVSTNITSTFPGWNTNHAYEYVPANFEDSNHDGLDDNGDDWSFANTMAPGKGYTIMVPVPMMDSSANNPSEVVFSGKVNNGIQKITGIIPDMSYLIGNPYPSALDAEAFLDYNSDVLDGTLYFWTHHTAIQDADPTDPTFGTGAHVYTSDDYASYNSVGGVGVGEGYASGSGGMVVPTGEIASGQGFFATSNAEITGANEIVFNNSMRLSNIGSTLNNNQFFKTKKPKEKNTNTTEKHRIWLNLSNTQGAFKQTLLGYVTGATNGNESRFDGQSFDGNEFVDFYSINQDKNLVIQGRALPFDENDQVPLGFKTTINGTFSINIDKVDGLMTNQNVYLEDKLTNTTFDLKSGNYIFSTTKGTFNNRFVLKYSNKSLGTSNFVTLKNKVLVTDSNQQIQINSFTESIDKVVVYDLLGRPIYQKNKVNSAKFLITDLVSNHQTLVVKTTLQSGEIVANKIFY